MNGLNEYNDNDIVNRALLKLGQETVIDLTEDNERARAANALYNSVRDTLLSTYRWNFATKRAILEACELTPAFGWVNSLFLFPWQPGLRAVMPHTLVLGTIEPHKDKPFYASLPHNCIYSLFIAFV